MTLRAQRVLDTVVELHVRRARPRRLIVGAVERRLVVVE